MVPPFLYTNDLKVEGAGIFFKGEYAEFSGALGANTVSGDTDGTTIGVLFSFVFEEDGPRKNMMNMNIAINESRSSAVFERSKAVIRALSDLLSTIIFF